MWLLRREPKSKEVFTYLVFDHIDKEDFHKVKCSCGRVSDTYPWADYLEQIEDAHLAGHTAEGKVIAHRFDG